MRDRHHDHTSVARVCTTRPSHHASTELPDSAGGGGGGGGSSKSAKKDADKPVRMNRSVMLATVQGTASAEVYAAIASLPEDEQYDQCAAVMQQAWNDSKSS